MDSDAADPYQSLQPHPSSASKDAAEGIEEAEQSRQQPDHMEIEADEAESERASQHVRTLGKMRFRPADDDEPQ